MYIYIYIWASFLLLHTYYHIFCFRPTTSFVPQLKTFSMYIVLSLLFLAVLVFPLVTWYSPPRSPRDSSQDRLIFMLNQKYPKIVLELFIWSSQNVTLNPVLARIGTSCKPYPRRARYYETNRCQNDNTFLGISWSKNGYHESILLIIIEPFIIIR